MVKKKSPSKRISKPEVENVLTTKEQVDELRKFVSAELQKTDDELSKSLENLEIVKNSGIDVPMQRIIPIARLTLQAFNDNLGDGVKKLDKGTIPSIVSQLKDGAAAQLAISLIGNMLDKVAGESVAKKPSSGRGHGQ